MDFIGTIRHILRNGQMTLPKITDIILKEHSHLKANTRDQTLTRIRNEIRENDNFILHDDLSPMEASIYLNDGNILDKQKEEVLEDYEKENGIVYILKTKTFTKENEEIIKIGFTTQSIEKRVNQLYTTGTPYKFTIFEIYEVKNYIELEKALHKLLKPFQINHEREFFTDKALKYIDNIVEIHNSILKEELT